MSRRHPTWEGTIETLESPGGVDQRTGKHLEDCPRCRLVANGARVLLATLEDAGIGGPSEALKDQTWVLLREDLQSRAQRHGDWPESADRAFRGAVSRVKEIWATIVADSLKPSLSVRGTTYAAPRALVYEAADFAISVSITPDPGGETVSIMGQLIPKLADSVPEGGRVELNAGPTHLEDAISNLGEFRFRDIPKGRIEIVVAVGDLRIRLAPLPF
jgi:hypothetical protein